MARVDPGCAGERTLLLWEENGEDSRLHESYNDVKTAFMLKDGWVDVTGVKEYEERAEVIRAAGAVLHT